MPVEAPATPPDLHRAARYRWRAVARGASLIAQLTSARHAQGRYRGSFAGVALAVPESPLLTLAVFAVVFGVILEGKFTGHPSESRSRTSRWRSTRGWSSSISSRNASPARRA